MKRQSNRTKLFRESLSGRNTLLPSFAGSGQSENKPRAPECVLVTTCRIVKHLAPLHAGGLEKSRSGITPALDNTVS